MKKQIVYNVYYYNVNSRSIELYNVLKNFNIKDLKNDIKNNKVCNYNDLREYLKKYFMVNYCARSEYEISISGLFEKESQKIDAYNQAIINIDLIVTYLISELKINFRNRENR